MAKTTTTPPPIAVPPEVTVAEADARRLATAQAIAAAEQTLADLRAVTGDRDNRLDRLLVQEELVDLAKQLEADTAECVEAGLRERSAAVAAFAATVPDALAEAHSDLLYNLDAWTNATANLLNSAARGVNSRQALGHQAEALVDGDRIQLNNTFGVMVDGVPVNQRIAEPLAGEVAGAVAVSVRRAGNGALAEALAGYARVTNPLPRPAKSVKVLA